MKGTRYDRYFCEEFMKRVKDNQEIEDLINKIKSFKDEEAV